MLSDSDLDELERLAEAATPGEWRAQETNVGIMCRPRLGHIHPTLSCFIVGIAPDNARAIAATHNALPSLIAALRAERARSDRLAKLLGEARLLIRHCAIPAGEVADDPTPDEWWTRGGVERAAKKLVADIDAALSGLAEKEVGDGNG